MIYDLWMGFVSIGKESSFILATVQPQLLVGIYEWNKTVVGLRKSKLSRKSWQESSNISIIYFYPTVNA